MRRLRLPLLALSLTLLASSCVTPAFDRSDYISKVVPTVESAVSSLETAALAIQSWERHGLPQAPVSVSVSDAEDVLGSVSGTFESIQPPEEELDDLRERVLDLLDEAEEQMGEARIAVRRGDVEGAVQAMEPAEQTVKDLEAILTELGA